MRDARSAHQSQKSGKPAIFASATVRLHVAIQNLSVFAYRTNQKADHKDDLRKSFHNVLPQMLIGARTSEKACFPQPDASIDLTSK